MDLPSVDSTDGRQVEGALDKNAKIVIDEIKKCWNIGEIRRMLENKVTRRDDCSRRASIAARGSDDCSFGAPISTRGGDDCVSIPFDISPPSLWREIYPGREFRSCVIITHCASIPGSLFVWQTKYPDNLNRVKGMRLCMSDACIASGVWPRDLKGKMIVTPLRRIERLCPITWYGDWDIHLGMSSVMVGTGKLVPSSDIVLDSIFNIMRLEGGGCPRTLILYTILRYYKPSEIRLVHDRASGSVVIHYGPVSSPSASPNDVLIYDLGANPKMSPEEVGKMMDAHTASPTFFWRNLGKAIGELASGICGMMFGSTLPNDPIIKAMAGDGKCYCGNVGKSMCSQCQTASYCSQVCQYKAWPLHRLMCSP